MCWEGLMHQDRAVDAVDRQNHKEKEHGVDVRTLRREYVAQVDQRQVEVEQQIDW